MTSFPALKQGDIWLVDFNPSIGDEIKKIRPAIILNGNFAIGLDLKIVAPITSWKEDFDKIWWLYKVKANKKNGLEKDSVINCYQIRTVSEIRFKKKLGELNFNDLEEVIATSQNCLEIC